MSESNAAEATATLTPRELRERFTADAMQYVDQLYAAASVSYTHLTLPTNREV